MTRVVDLSRSTAGRFCSKLFALGGDHVVRFVAKQGDGPRRDADAAGLDELRRVYLDVGDVRVDWDDRRDVERATDATAAADVVITSFEWGRYDAPFDHDAVRRINQRAVHVTVSPFGLDGPYRSYGTSSLVDWAASGYLYTTGEPDRPPLPGPPELCGYVAGYTAAVAAEAAVFAGLRSRPAAHVDISTMECMLSVHNNSMSRLAHGEVVRRAGNDVGAATYPHRAYRARDGELFVGVVTDAEWDRFTIAIDRPELAVDERLLTGAARKEHVDLVDDIVATWLEGRAVDDAASLLQSMRVPATRLCTAADVLSDPQLKMREFARPYHVGERTGWAPGDPVRAADRPRSSDFGPPFGPELGPPDGLPLQGVRVLDMSAWWAGPSAARILGDLGAHVVRVEQPARSADEQFPAFFSFVHEKMNRNKVGIAVDLKHEDGRQVVARLAERADVIIQNFRPGTLDQLGLGYGAVAAANPGVVYVSLSGYGSLGPKANWGSYGTVIEAASSIRARTRYPDGPGMKLAHALPDGVGGIVGALAAVRGLRHRAGDGRGSHYDVSQLESYVAMSGEGILAASLDADAGTTRSGSEATADVERVLRCAGADQWIAVALPDRLAEQRVHAAFGVDNESDRAWDVLEEVAAASDKVALAGELQALGIPAFPLLDTAEVAQNGHLEARGYFVDVEIGGVTGKLPGSPLRSSPAPLVHFARPAPRTGQHTTEVLARDLGFSPNEIDRLVAEGIVIDSRSAVDPPLATHKI